jgi:hypothetical protein
MKMDIGLPGTSHREGKGALAQKEIFAGSMLE